MRERERERERERARMSGGGAKREGDTESKASSRLWAASTDPDVGLKSVNREIMTWAKETHLTLCHPGSPETSFFLVCQFKNGYTWGARLAQLVEWATLDLRVMSSSPTLGVELSGYSFLSQLAEILLGGFHPLTYPVWAVASRLPLETPGVWLDQTLP